MKKEDLLNDDFLKQFKSGEELESFLSQLHKRGIEKMLEGEIDAHLDYSKSQRSGNDNYRNGTSKKRIKTAYGESEITVPRDRDASFEPQIVPKRSRLAKGIESMVISLYAKGMSNSDIEEQIRELYDFRISTSTISKITDKITDDIVAWQNRPLESLYFIVWMDGIVFKVRDNSRVINKTVILNKTRLIQKALTGFALKAFYLHRKTLPTTAGSFCIGIIKIEAFSIKAS